MEILLIETDKITRDHIKVGMECFQDIKVEVADGFAAINRARQRKFDYIFIGHDAGVQDGLAELHALREFDHETSVVIVTSSRQAKQLANERTKLNIYSCLHRPIEEREFFRLVTRMRERAVARN